MGKFIELADVGLQLNRHRIFHHLTISIPLGGICVIEGPNGCGKTTLLNLLSGTIVPDDGRILVKGTDITHWDAAKRTMQLGMTRTFQVPFLVNDFSVIDNLIAGPAIRESTWHYLFGKFDMGPVREKVGLLWKRLQLPVELLDYKAEKLSFGQRRIVDLVRCLCTPGKIMLLDEPFANLHDSVVAAVKTFIENLIKNKAETTVLVVTHEKEHLSGWDHNVLHMQRS